MVLPLALHWALQERKQHAAAQKAAEEKAAAEAAAAEAAAGDGAAGDGAPGESAEAAGNPSNAEVVPLLQPGWR